MKRFLNLFRFIVPYWAYAVLNVIFNILSAIAALFSTLMVIPFLRVLFERQEITAVKPESFELNANSIQNYFNYFMASIINDYGKTTALITVCILVVGITFLKTGFKYVANYYMAPLRNNVVRDLRRKIFRKMVVLPLSFFSDSKKGDIISRITSDVQEVEQSIISSLAMLFRDPITIILFLVMLIYMSPQLTLFVLIMLPISTLLIGRLGKNLKQKSLSGQKRMGTIISIVEETLNGLRIIKAFNAENKINDRFDNTINTYNRIMIKIFRRRFLASPLSELLGTIVMVTVMWYGGTLVLDGKGNLSGEALIAYLMIFYQIIAPAKAFSTAYFNIQKGLASLTRIDELIDADIEIKEIKNPVPLEGFKDSIEYKNVTFKYEQDKVLKNINLKIEKGKTIAIVGHSGSGKSTMVDLLPRFYDPIEGEILIDGVNIKNLKIKELRTLMGIVSQDSILFNDTFFNNIAFSKDAASENEVVEAAKVANAREFIEASKNDYHFNIGDKGNKLSGGQKQRVSIARAVLKNPPILILDEATSSLDTESERLVQEALFELMKNRTSLVIAHRLSTIQNADEIIVLHEGEIVERGTHTELLAKNGHYKKLNEMQNSTN
ncbi:MAG: antibiotic ABC transporter ATP-binding protein [Marinilabiliales bacterium]|nr:MAG: antibiotic ABC transporter ATP-binding protein [Marinilabiliales bacterium]